MPFNRLWREEIEEDNDLIRDAVLELREQIVSARQELELFETEEWREFDAILASRQENAFRDILVGEPDQMILARERARVYRDLRELPNRLQDKIADLTTQVKEIEGE